MPQYYMFNKPKDCVTARTDALSKTVMDYFPKEQRHILHPSGRLDKDTTGLLIITDDGMLTHRLMQPKSHVKKTYFFYAIGTLTDEKTKAIRSGITVKGMSESLMPADISMNWQGRITEIEDYLPDKKRESLLKNPAQQVFSGYITIAEGKNHQVKRMLKAIDCCIVYLHRVSIGGISLDTSLLPGCYRPLTDDELSSLL